MSGRRALVCLAVLLPAWGGAQTPATGASRVIDRAVAVVEGRVRSLSQLICVAKVSLIQQGGLEAAFAERDAQTLEPALINSIGERLEAAEAEKLQAYPLEEGELEAALRALEDRFTRPKDFERFLAVHDVDRQA